jgi:hypothetical protein
MLCIENSLRRYTRFRGEGCEVRENRRHMKRSRVRDISKEVESTGDLNGIHGVRSTLSSEGAQSEMHPESVSEEEKYVGVVVTLMLE